jgi:hypothetical protein
MKPGVVFHFRQAEKESGRVQNPFISIFGISFGRAFKEKKLRD